MRTFVTGASGFVGTWLTRHLEACGDEVYPLRDEFDIADERAVGREAFRRRRTSSTTSPGCPTSGARGRHRRRPSG